MQKKITTILSFLLCICLLCTMLPASAFASGDTGNVISDTNPAGTDGTDDSGTTTTPGSDGSDTTTTPGSDGSDTTTAPGSDGSDSTTTPEPKPEPLTLKGSMYKTRYAYLTWKSDSTKNTYYVYRSTKKTSGFKKIGTVSSKTGTVKFYDKKEKLTLGKTYYYKVKKLVNKKTIETSNTVSVKIRLLPVTNAKAAITSKNDVKLTWTKSSYATSYSIYRCTSKTGEFKKIGTTTKTTYTDTSPSSGKAYYYKIYARRSGVSANSKSCSILAAYTKTSKPKVTATYASKKVTLSWSKVTRATLYYVYRKNSEGKYVYIGKTKDLSYTDDTVSANKSYSYKVRGAYTKDDAIHKGFYSAVVTIYTTKIDPKKKMVALTFDDGPGPYTDEIVDCLNKYGGHATFFVVGNRVNSYADELSYAFSSGNEIANHTYSHPTLTKLSTTKIKSEISKTDAVVKKITGVAPSLMRAPGGATNSTVRKAAGKPFIYWSIDTLDWKHRNATKTVNTVMNNVKDGDIILMHDIHKPSMTAALTLIPKLKKAGYQLVTVSELAKYRGYKLKNGTTYYSFR